MAITEIVENIAGQRHLLRDLNANFTCNYTSQSLLEYEVY